MTSFRKLLFGLGSIFYFSVAFAGGNTLNVYTFSQEIPPNIIKQFETETGIKVHYSTYDSNEMMFAKLRATSTPVYDVIEPSSFYIDKLRHLGMLASLDKTLLPNFKNVDPDFLNHAYDPQNQFSVPFIWGVTGIFVNQNYYTKHAAIKWSDLADKKFLNQLMFLDDAREVFSIALKMKGYSINDNDPNHIKEAYLLLKNLMPNIRLFNTEAIISILIDEDATVGMTWNGDLYKAHQENDKLHFVYPSDGFEIWVDNFAILKNAPHLANSYLFLNFLLRPDIAKAIALSINYSTANLAAKKTMPLEIQHNPYLYPSKDILARGEFENDIGDKASVLFEKYWEQLKIFG